MSKYYDLEKIGGYLERIAVAVEKIAELEQPQEEVKKEEVEELAREEAKEPQEASKDEKSEELVKEEVAIELPGETKEVEAVLEDPKEKFLELAKKTFMVKEEPKVEPKKEPVKRGDSRHEIRKHRISPYRIKEQGTKATSSGFRIKED